MNKTISQVFKIEIRRKIHLKPHLLIHAMLNNLRGKDFEI